MIKILTLVNGVQIPDGSIINILYASLIGNQQITSNITVVQYDNTIPIVGVNLLTDGNKQYIPTNDDLLTVRMGKPDGHGVVNDCLGYDENGTIYFAITQQMAASWGMGSIVIEISNTVGTKSSSVIKINITENPVKEGQIESADEFKTLTELLVEVRNAIDLINENENALNFIENNPNDIKNVSDNVDSIKTTADNIDNVNNVSNSTTNIITVSNNINDINNISNNIEDIEIISNNINNINNVGENITNVNIASNNIEAIKDAPNYAKLSESWAIGGTGTREGENTNNAKYYSQVAQEIAQGQLGWFSTEQALESAHPTGQNGQWAIIGSTDTIWTWDSDTNSWVNSGNQVDLSNYYTKTQSDDTFAPISHASSYTTYGVGNSSYYGHVKLYDSIGSYYNVSYGYAATPYAVYNYLNTYYYNKTQLEENYAPYSHAEEYGRYGIGNNTLYGHVKLSDTPSSNGQNNGVAATPKCVQDAISSLSPTEIVLLWTNSNTHTQFSARKISVNLSSYNLVLIMCRRGSETGDRYERITTSMIVPVGEGGVLIVQAEGTAYREFDTDQSGVTFMNGANNSNGSCIPYKIYGIKL